MVMNSASGSRALQVFYLAVGVLCVVVVYLGATWPV